MAYVITEPCVATCDTACVDACPVDCIHGPLPLEDIRAAVEGGAPPPSLQLYIDPEACICCAQCESRCPVNAIFDEDEVPAQWRADVARNAAFFAARR